jgi:hypothetical protein
VNSYINHIPARVGKKYGKLKGVLTKSWHNKKAMQNCNRRLPGTLPA